jgi:hypothetical protein
MEGSTMQLPKQSSPYCVELQEETSRSVIAIGVQPLDSLASWFASQGKHGVLELVERQTGAVIIRCPVRQRVTAMAAQPWSDRENV